jgi:tetratricopeptide (TPR) repeat protein
MDVLYQIIEGLSKEEIRFFKIFAHRQGAESDRKDIALLDFIRKYPHQEAESKIVSKLYGNGDKNPFYRLKNRLLEDLNRALVLQHNSDEEILQILHLLSVVRIYTTKNQQQVAFSFLKKAEQKALKVENHELLDIIYGEFIQLSHTLLVINPELYIAKRKENNESLARLRQMDDVLAVVSYRLKVSQNFGEKENALMEMLESVTAQFAEESGILRSARFRIKLYSLVSQLLLQKKDYINLEAYLLRTWKELNEAHLFTRNNHDTKLQMLTYIVNTLFKNGKIKESLEYAEQLHSAMEEFNQLLFDKYEIFYYNALVNNYSTSDIPKAIELLQEMLKRPNLNKVPFYELFIYLNLATSYFDLKNYNQAIKNLNKLYHIDSYKKADKTLRFKISLAELIIRYELGDLDFWKYRYEQVLREYQDDLARASAKREKAMLLVMNKSVDWVDGLKNRSKRAELDDLLKQLKEEASEDEVIQYFRWLNDKVHGS